MISDLEGSSLDGIQQLSAAEKLLRMFDKMTDVSYICVKHDIDSGFVTYQKEKNQQALSTQLTETETVHLAHQIEIDSWRQMLGLNDNKEIMVAFAWAHDVELRKLRMFPELIAVDCTFGVNKQSVLFLQQQVKIVQTRSLLDFDASCHQSRKEHMTGRLEKLFHISLEIHFYSIKLLLVIRKRQ